MCQILVTKCQFEHKGKKCDFEFLDEDRSAMCPMSMQLHINHQQTVINEKEDDIPASTRCSRCKAYEDAIDAAYNVAKEVMYTPGYRAETPAPNRPGPTVMSSSSFQAASSTQQYQAQPAYFPGYDASNPVASPASSSGYNIKPRHFYNSLSESDDSEQRSSHRQAGSQPESSHRSSDYGGQIELPSSSPYMSSSDDGGRDSRKSSSAGGHNQHRQDTETKRKHVDSSSSHRSSRHSSSSSHGSHKPSSSKKPHNG